MTKPSPEPPPPTLRVAFQQLRYVARMSLRRDVRLGKLHTLAAAGRAIDALPLTERTRARLRRRMAAHVYRLVLADITDTASFHLPGAPW